MESKLAQAGDIIGRVERPPGIGNGGYGSINQGGPTAFISNIIKLLIVAAGVYAVLNIVIAGLGFISAGGDPKKIADAWAKIWQSLLGLTVAAGSFVIAGLMGQILFGDPNALLQITIFGP
jgi:hypothetical protein